MTARPLALVAVTLFAGLATHAAARGGPPELSWKTFDAVRDRILPTEKEVGWQAIPWRGDFGQALSEAARKDMPLLVWAMNGDPLGCT